MRPRVSVFPLLFLFLVLTALGGLIGFFLTSYPGELPLPHTPEPQALSAALGSLEQRPTSVPVWLLILISGFTIVQILPLIMAAARARRASLTQRDYRTITFLCETPVYLGLLGSLIGVSMTQFISGTLAAPLAYMTTIAGILLFLFAKFTIWLPMYEKGPPRSRPKSKAIEA
ncbi:MAG: hypothetical protein J5J00_01000 [Deltaproteobacteria bacterium]|nr:hypothetical protein [Deltaproteobacteria bacterium]